MKLSTLLLGTAGVLALAGSAQAAPHFHGWYVGLEGGANWVQDWDVVSATTISLPAHTHNDTYNFETGWAVLGTVGYAFTNNWRLEFEAGYRDNDIDSVIDQGGPTPFGPSEYDIDGSLREVSLMANVLYDIQLGSRMALTLGAGAGADHADLQFGGEASDASVEQWSFAYQGIVGLNYALSSRTDLVLNYRYLNVDSIDLDNGGPLNGHLITETDDFQKHTVTIGLRYDLTADDAPVVVAPPPPSEPPPVARQFIVFFGFNKCNITAEADDVLSQAASSAKALGSASVVIVGHTDTVGSNKYNQKLSECRANAARSNLESKGIASGSISTSGKGETELMVQTGDGVKEPQNRRATVDLN